MTTLPQHLQISSRWLPYFGKLDDLSRFHLPIRREGEEYFVNLRLAARERSVLRKRRQVPVSEWAERHRHIPRDAARPGLWRNAAVPYAAGIMDAAFHKSVQEIVVCAAPQTAKTELVYTCMGYTMDRRPGNWLVVFPNEKDAADNARDRIMPMIDDSPRLREYKTGYVDDESVLKIQLQHMRVYMAWATSAARLSNRPLPYVHLDEEDKYPATATGREASPQNLAKKRTRTFAHMRKVFRTSSPSIKTGPIWKALTEECQATFDFWVRCPECGTLQKMVFGDGTHHGIRWTDGVRDPNVIKASGDAWYQCAKCPAQWDDAVRDAAVRAGEWREHKTETSLAATLRSVNPITIGFHVPAWLSPFVKLWECAYQFLKGLNGGRIDWNEMKDFRNGFAAKPWEVREAVRQESRILDLRDDRPAGIVPGGGVVAALLAAVDTQDNGFWYEIRAFGYGIDPESWGVRCGFVDSFEALDQVLFKDAYYDVSGGGSYRVMFACQDAMGHRTSEVYDYCLKASGPVVPTQGKQRMGKNYDKSDLEYYPGTKKPIKKGLKLYRYNTNFYKDKLNGKLKVSTTDPGAWHYHSELSNEWARQMTAEALNPDTQLWEAIRRDNHAWDVSTLLLLAWDIQSLRYKLRPSAEETRTGSGRRILSRGVE